MNERMNGGTNEWRNELMNERFAQGLYAQYTVTVSSLTDALMKTALLPWRCYINEHLGNEYSLRLVELQSTG